MTTNGLAREVDPLVGSQAKTCNGCEQLHTHASPTLELGAYVHAQPNYPYWFK